MASARRHASRGERTSRADGGRSPGAAAHYDRALAASRDVGSASRRSRRAIARSRSASPRPGARVPQRPPLRTPGRSSVAPRSRRAARRRSPSPSDVRRAIAFAGRRSLIITTTSVVLPDGRTIDLSKRKNIRLCSLRSRRAATGSIPTRSSRPAGLASACGRTPPRSDSHRHLDPAEARARRNSPVQRYPASTPRLHRSYE